MSLLLNELELLNLAAETHKSNVSSIAYVPQEAWIFGGTIRENILVGRKFVQEKYKEVIEACSLGKVSRLFIPTFRVEIIYKFFFTLKLFQC